MTTDDKKDWCLNCGAELPYEPGQWPLGFPKLCPKCGVRVKDPINYGSKDGQGRTHQEQLKYPGLALFLSIIPGLGQVYNGQIDKGLLFLFGTVIGLFIFVIPGLLIWAYGVYDAYKTANKMNQGDFPFKQAKTSHGVIYLISIMLCIILFAGIGSLLLWNQNISGITFIPSQTSSITLPTPPNTPTLTTIGVPQTSMPVPNQQNSIVTHTHSPTTYSVFDISQVVGIGGVSVQNHWTDNDINDGKLVRLSLVTKRGEFIDPRDNDIRGITVKLRIIGHEGANEIDLFSKTYSNLNYRSFFSDSVIYPSDDENRGIHIYFNEIKDYDFQPIIRAEVILPDGRALESDKNWFFGDTKPLVY